MSAQVCLAGCEDGPDHCPQCCDFGQLCTHMRILNALRYLVDSMPECEWRGPDGTWCERKATLWNPGTGPGSTLDSCDLHGALPPIHPGECSYSDALRAAVTLLNPTEPCPVSPKP